MRDAYPYLDGQAELIRTCVKAEEEQFLRTLDNGLQMLGEASKPIARGGRLSGEVAFKLYDTYGFPLDLTRTICEENGIGVDEAGFEKAMEEQKQRSREFWKGGSDSGVAADYHAVAERLRKSHNLPEFVGYESIHAVGPCVAIISDDANGNYEAIFAKTPFYGESGGQIGDRGVIVSEDSQAPFDGEVVDVQRPLPDLIVIKVKANHGKLREGINYRQDVAKDLRELTAANHTATHLLHWALRKQLGKHVKQAGSLVTPESLRFDFTHFQGLTAAELLQIEAMVNAEIWAKHPVSKKVMGKDAAIASGAVAMFGEKYADEVRVVSVGDFAVELCGGTHVENAADILMFKIVSESSVAAGVRRIVAYTHRNAFKLLDERYQEAKLVREKLKANSTQEVEERLERMSATEKDLRKQIDTMKAQNLRAELMEVAANAKNIGGFAVVVQEITVGSDGMKTLRDAADYLKNKTENGIFVLGMRQPEDGKALVIAAAGKQLTGKWDASQLIRDIAPLIEGKGGGKADMAQAGGTNMNGLAPALARAQELIINHFNR